MPEFSQPQRPRKRRTVRWQDSFELSGANLAADVKRLDDLTAACIFRIEEDADACERVGDTPFRVAKAQEVPGSSVICVLFTITEKGDMCDLWFVYTTPDPVGDVDS